MGLFGSFKKKKKSSENSISTPDIADLPPIPEPSSNLDLSSSDNLSNLDLPDLPNNDGVLNGGMAPNSSDDALSLNDSSNLGSSDKEQQIPDPSLPNLPEDGSVLDLPDDALSLNDSSNLGSSDKEQSSKDLDTKLSNDSSSISKENTSLNSQESEVSENEVSENKTEDISQGQEDALVSKTDVKPSLPVFKEVTDSNQIDVDSLAITELFIEREKYIQVLEMLHNAKKELDTLVKKSAVAKPNEKMSVLLKNATAKHTGLNKGLMFVEEHLIE